MLTDNKIQFRENGIPLVMNTIENCYKNICIVGEGETANDLYRYLKDNQNVTTEIAPQNSGGTFLQHEADIAILTDNKYKNLVYSEKGPVYSVHYNQLLENNVEEPFVDIWVF